MKEIWKPVQGYEGIYKISNKGRLISLDRYITREDGAVFFRQGREISYCINTDGYYQCKLCKDGGYKTTRIHRIVAEHFIPNPNNYEEVNHIDYDRKNNNVDNLEWCTHEDNIKHSQLAGHYNNKQGVNNPNFGGTKLKEYFAAHPEERMKLGRKGAQNGRARPVTLVMDGKTYTYNYIGECASFLIDNKIINNVKHSTLSARIGQKIKSGEPYRGLIFLDK